MSPPSGQTPSTAGRAMRPRLVREALRPPGEIELVLGQRRRPLLHDEHVPVALDERRAGVRVPVVLEVEAAGCDHPHSIARPFARPIAATMPGRSFEAVRLLPTKRIRSGGADWLARPLPRDRRPRGQRRERAGRAGGAFREGYDEPRRRSVQCSAARNRNAQRRGGRPVTRWLLHSPGWRCSRSPPARPPPTRRATFPVDRASKGRNGPAQQPPELRGGDGDPRSIEASSLGRVEVASAGLSGEGRRSSTRRSARSGRLLAPGADPRKRAAQHRGGAPGPQLPGQQRKRRGGADPRAADRDRHPDVQPGRRDGEHPPEHDAVPDRPQPRLGSSSSSPSRAPSTTSGRRRGRAWPSTCTTWARARSSRARTS